MKAEFLSSYSVYDVNGTELYNIGAYICSDCGKSILINLNEINFINSKSPVIFCSFCNSMLFLEA